MLYEITLNTELANILKHSSQGKYIRLLADIWSNFCETMYKPVVCIFLLEGTAINIAIVDTLTLSEQLSARQLLFAGSSPHMSIFSLRHMMFL